MVSWVAAVAVQCADAQLVLTARRRLLVVKGCSCCSVVVQMHSLSWLQEAACV